MSDTVAFATKFFIFRLKLLSRAEFCDQSSSPTANKGPRTLISFATKIRELATNVTCPGAK